MNVTNPPLAALSLKREYATSLGASLKAAFRSEGAPQFDDLLRALDAAERALVACDYSSDPVSKARSSGLAALDLLPHRRP